MLHLNTNISFHLVLSHSCHRFILVMDWVTRYYTLLCSVSSFWSFLHHFCIFQIGGGPLLHCNIGSRLRCRLFWRLQISSSWSRGTMLLTCDNIGHVPVKSKSEDDLKYQSHPKQKQHEGLDGDGSSDDATKKTMAADEHPRVQVVIAARRRLCGNFGNR